MTEMNDKLWNEIEKLRREVERMRTLESGGGVWQSWTPTFQGFSVDPTGWFRYTLIGKMCYVMVRMSGGTSNSSIFRMDAPVEVSANQDYYYNSLAVMVNGATVRFGYGMVQARNKLAVYPNELWMWTDIGVSWVTSGDKRASFQIAYEID